MWDLLDRIFASNLELGNATVSVQKEIFKYGVKEKNYDLLTKLANYQFLDKVIADSFTNNNLSEIRKIWLVSKNIKSKDVITLLAKEKRSAVLLAVADNPKRGNKVFQHLMENSSDSSLLFTLLNNSGVDDKLKVKILVKCISLKNNNSNGVRLSTFTSELIYSEDKGLLNAILSEPKLIKLSSLIVDHNGIKAEEITLLANSLLVELEEIWSKYREDSLTLIELNERFLIINELLPKLEFNAADFLRLNNLLSDISSRSKGSLDPIKGREFAKKIKKISTTLNKDVKSSSQQFKLEIDNAVNRADLVLLYNKAYKLFGSKIINYRERDIIRMMLADSKAADLGFSESMLDIIEGIYTPGDYARYLTRPESYAIALSKVELPKVREALALSSNPTLCFEVLLRTIAINDGYIPDSFFEEGLMGEEEILALPVELISLSGYPKEVEALIMDTISKTINTPASWEVFTTLSKNFEGSLKDLLNISAKI